MNFILKLALVLLNFSLINGRKPPEISVYEIQTADSYKMKKTTSLPNKGEGEYYSLIGNDLLLGGNTNSITLKCDATYPVYWTIESQQSSTGSDDPGIMEYDLGTHTSREGDISTTSPEQWGFSAILRFWIISQSMTKNYTCRSVDDEKLSTSRYIFTEGGSFNYLLNAGETFTIRMNSQPLIYGPCKVSTPNTEDMQLKLFKEEIQVAEPFNFSKWELVKTNESIKFDPHVGYVFKVRDLPTIFGSYKCTADDTNENDVVHFDIVLDSGQEPLVDNRHSNMRISLQGTATMFVDYKNGIVQCCSNSEKRPKMKMISCSNPPECEFLRPIIVAKKLKHPEWYYHHLERYGTSNCSASYIMSGNFWLDCEGDGIDIFSLYTYAYRNTSEIFRGYLAYDMPRVGYTIEPTTTVISNDNLINLDYIEDVEKGVKNAHNLRYSKLYRVANNSTTMELFSQQRILFICYKSSFHFSDGVYWEVKWKNGTLKRFKSEDDSANEYYYAGRFEQLSLEVDLQMSSISCHVSPWNTTEWLSKSEDLPKIKESQLPKVQSDPHETVHWYVNETDKFLECSFSGQPVPKITWEKDGQELPENELFSIQQVGNHGRLDIGGKITHEIQGEFSCIGTNFRGKSLKIFSVVVEENSSYHTAVTVVILLAVVGISMGVAVVGWQMRQRHKTLLAHPQTPTTSTSTVA